MCNHSSEHVSLPLHMEEDPDRYGPETQTHDWRVGGRLSVAFKLSDTEFLQMTRHTLLHEQLDERTSTLIGGWCHGGFCKPTVEPILDGVSNAYAGTDDRLTSLLYERPPQP